METQNDFMILRETVNKAVSQYNELRKRIDWRDAGKSATIYRLAKPFQTGYFTIAIAGKMSSGKSTFINSLIGENLLPTGIFQTTSGITWIVSSDKRYMEVTYADGKKKTFTENLEQELQKLVAVPDEFHSLPINDLNILIKGDDDLKSILQKKEGIEEKTKTSSDEKLWKAYVAATPKSKIADEVVIYLPLPDEYKGWRIVDTPGIGAIGGIQQATRELITSKEGDNNVVDAVILLHNGAEGVEGTTVNTFAEEVKKSMGNLAQGRLFFVLTHAAHSDFLNNIEGHLERAYNNFSNKLAIPQERVTYVDSLIHRFLVDAKKSHRDFSSLKSLKTPLDGWSEKDWKALKDALSPFYMSIMEEEDIELSNKSLFSLLESVSRFEILRELLYEFLNTEKEKAFNELLSLIKSELTSYGVSLRNDIKAVSNGQAAVEKEIKKAEEEGRRLNLALVKVQQTATPGAIEKNFKFIDAELLQLSTLSSIDEVRTKYMQIIEEGLSAQEKFFATLINDFSNFVGGFSNESVTFQSLDLKDLERQAQNKATTQVPDLDRSKEIVKKKSSGRKEVIKTYPYKKDKIDFDQKRREFTALVVKEGRHITSVYTLGLIVKVKEFFDIVSSSINEKTKKTIERLEEYKKRMAHSEAILNELRAKLAAVDSQLEELKKLED
ncbi:dynamin family protein [Bacteroides acidifaciens]|uniref:dynamin family protein n=2 Tax=Pseudomonadati TaxID=3379134 RepID=UPI0026053E54|nr:dynamin family protein [Bacteroides acidifaciens]